MGWRILFKSMIPDQYVKSIYNIDFIELKRRGFKAVIVDLDNTLVEASRADATPRLIEWLDQIKQMGFKVMIVSNNNKMRVSKFALPLHIPFIYTAKKPLSLAFRKAMRMLNVQKQETIVIGDQLLTDVLGGNRMGIYTILVVPVSNVEGFTTRMNRRIERFVFRRLRKRGLLRWEESH